MKKEQTSAILDTSFFIRLLNNEDALCQRARDFLRYMLEQNYVLKISTIAMAEFCVRAKLEELPLRCLQILPFTDEHVSKAAEYARVVFDGRKAADDIRRIVIPNDTKMFAQAEVDRATYYITADSESLVVYGILTDSAMTHFKVVDIRSQDYLSAFGVLC